MKRAAKVTGAFVAMVGVGVGAMLLGATQIGLVVWR